MYLVVHESVRARQTAAAWQHCLITHDALHKKRRAVDGNDHSHMEQPIISKHYLSSCCYFDFDASWEWAFLLPTVQYRYSEPAQRDRPYPSSPIGKFISSLPIALINRTTMLLGALKTLGGGARLVGLSGAARGSVSSTIESCSSSDLPAKLLWRCRRASISTTPSSKHNSFSTPATANTSAHWGFHPTAALGLMGAIAGLGVACK